MGLAQDLLRQAEHLASYESPLPTQASLRRAVSTCYYALFHLLTDDAAARWPGTPEARTAIERGFKHATMKSVSADFRELRWRDRRGGRRDVPGPLRNVARTFFDLQERRHTADYVNYHEWSTFDVNYVLELTRKAFVDWQQIRDHPMAGNYLIAMLLGK